MRAESSAFPVVQPEFVEEEGFLVLMAGLYQKGELEKHVQRHHGKLESNTRNATDLRMIGSQNLCESHANN